MHLDACVSTDNVCGVFVCYRPDFVRACSQSCVCVRSEQQHFDEAPSRRAAAAPRSSVIVNEINQSTVSRHIMSYRFIIDRQCCIPEQGM